MKSLRIVCFVLVLATASLAWADDLWDRESGSWDRKDAEKILNSSPWGKSVATKMEYVKNKDKQSTSSGMGSRTAEFDRGDPTAGDFANVWWWSARTPRRAFMRIYELSGGKPSKEQVEQFAESKATAILISIMGGGSMVAVSGKLPEEELQKAAWIQSVRLDKRIDAEAVQVVMAGGRPDRILFKFPLEVDGKPLITSEDKRLIFRWKLPKSPKEKLSDAQLFEVVFEPSKMIAHGEADY